MNKSVIRTFAEKTGNEWPELFNAEELTQHNYNKIIEKCGNRLFSSDVDLVVFGSIARNECTVGSDVDWTLLVDGQANADHLDIAHFIEDSIISTGLAEHGTTGMFGQTTFSHDLIHYIGGEDDTNHNISRRILLLLESDRISLDPLSDKSGTAHDRVIRGIIQQYIDNDSGFAAPTRKENVPRFLLNDIVRFWRTMCVDFAYKQREQQGKKWALRNIKLRMSRRLIFVKGLLMCFESYNTNFVEADIKQNLCKFVAKKPLEFMVSVLEENNISDGYIIDLLDSYDKYLGMLNDEEFRNHLKNLPMHKAYGDQKFEEARVNSHKFQDTLNKIFIQEKNSISEFILKYGIF